MEVAAGAGAEGAVAAKPATREEQADAGPTVVGDIMGRTPVTCPQNGTLTDVAEQLINQNRTAAMVVDVRGSVVGAMTENDILQAYMIGVPKDYSVDAWLRGDCARLPNFVVSALTVHPTTTLEAAASVMRGQLVGDYACHHLLVKDESWPYRGILSALDLARAICKWGSASRFGSKRVSDVMKPRNVLPVCSQGGTLSQAVQEMLLARQNCVLVADGDATSPSVLGVITPRDILRAFMEKVPGSALSVNWMHGLESRWERRTIRSDAPLAEAAEVMASNTVHHLAVISPKPGLEEVVGLLSSADVAYSLVGACAQ